ncbi:hypothetical protein SUGI_1190320 [Cryptomeria japonica]|nr:hypothetical protein SUGI_1190320 [Cryptomeria japonica]
MGFAGNFSGLTLPEYVVKLVYALVYMRNVIGGIRSWAGICEPQDNPSVISSCRKSDRLPVCTLGCFEHKFKKGEEDVMCAVCLSSIQKDDKIRELCDCHHVFHRKCLDKWIDYYHHTCPLCRSSLVAESVGEELSW